MGKQRGGFGPTAEVDYREWGVEWNHAIAKRIGHPVGASDRGTRLVAYWPQEQQPSSLIQNLVENSRPIVERQRATTAVEATRPDPMDQRGAGGMRPLCGGCPYAD